MELNRIQARAAFSCPIRSRKFMGIPPKLDGVKLAVTIREMCPSTPIVLFSGQAGTPYILQEARRRGHEFEVLPKPIHPLKLLERLTGLRSRRATDFLPAAEEPRSSDCGPG